MWGIRHIISAHLDVAINTYRAVDGNIYDCNKYGVQQVGGLRNDFYVEPETGILRAAVNYRKWRSLRRAKEAAKLIEVVAISDGVEYRKIKGLWFYGEFVEAEGITPRMYRGNRIGKTKTTVLVSEFKRQLCRKKLKALGLKNG